MKSKNKAFSDYKSNYYLIQFFVKICRFLRIENRLIRWLELLIIYSKLINIIFSLLLEIEIEKKNKIKVVIKRNIFFIKNLSLY